ncbi:hypothetical protein CPB85DRAFT_1281754 [Mucidula mucida]|nr:hypothetical protein CPB85DRAFT_1281754 [Mucidula mucida]
MFRIAAPRRLSRFAVQKRFTSSVKEGSVAQSKGFAEKERSQEAAFVRQHEAAQLEKLRQNLLKAQTDLDAALKDVQEKQAKVEGKNSKE